MKSKGNRFCIALASIAVLLQTFATLAAGQSDPPASYTFVALDIPLPNGEIGFTDLSDINDAGQIAGGFTSSSLGPYGFLLNFKKARVHSTPIRCVGKHVVDTAPQSINSHGEIAGFATS